MSDKELKRVDSLSSWYTDVQLDFDKRLIRFRYESIKPSFNGESCLELGPADSQMTRFLIKDFKKTDCCRGFLGSA